MALLFPDKRNLISIPFPVSTLMSVLCKSPLITHAGRTAWCYVLNSCTALVWRAQSQELVRVLHRPLLPDDTRSWCKRKVEKWDVHTGVRNLSKKGTLTFALFFCGWIALLRISSSSEGIWAVIFGLCDHHAFLHSDYFHREPMVRRDRWLYLHYTGGHGAMQRKNTAGQISVQWLWEGGGKWCYTAVELWGWLCESYIHFYLLRNDKLVNKNNCAQTRVNWDKRGRSYDSWVL